MKFLAIVSSNLDEFFMKRIGGLKQQAAAGVSEVTVDGRTPTRQIADCLAFIRDLDLDIGATYRELLEELARREIVVCSWRELPPDQRRRLRQYYITNISAGDAARDGPGSPVSVHFKPVPDRWSRYNIRPTTMVLARVKVPVGSGVPPFPEGG